MCKNDILPYIRLEPGGDIPLLLRELLQFRLNKLFYVPCVTNIGTIHGLCCNEMTLINHKTIFFRPPSLLE
jgi:hypothetical protein